MDKQNLTSAELQLRLQNGGLKIFCKDQTMAEKAAKDQLELQGHDLLLELKGRHKALREMLLDMGTPRVAGAFVARAKASHPEYSHFETPEDFYQLIKTGPFDNAKRALVNDLSNMMWSKKCIEEIEAEVMIRCRIKYKNVLVSGKEVKNKRNHGTIRTMFNRLKQTNHIDKVRYAHQILCSSSNTEALLIHFLPFP